MFWIVKYTYQDRFGRLTDERHERVRGNDPLEAIDTAQPDHPEREIVSLSVVEDDTAMAEFDATHKEQ